MALAGQRNEFYTGVTIHTMTVLLICEVHGRISQGSYCNLDCLWSHFSRFSSGDRTVWYVTVCTQALLGSEQHWLGSHGGLA